MTEAMRGRCGDSGAGNWTPRVPIGTATLILPSRLLPFPATTSPSTVGRHGDGAIQHGGPSGNRPTLLCWRRLTDRVSGMTSTVSTGGGRTSVGGVSC